MDSYKEQVQQLETGNREILKEKQRLEEELRNMVDTCTYLETDRDRNVEQVQVLEEHLKELELGGGTTLDKVVSHRASVVIDEEDLDVQGNMEENMKKANVTELRLTIGRLQRQIKEMEVNNDLVEEAESLRSHKDQIQKDYSSVLEERNRLRNELSQIRNGIPDSLLNQTQTIMAFRSRILDLEKESARLKECTVKLETQVLEGTHNVAKDVNRLEHFESEHSSIQDRLNRLEDITKMQLHDINRMLVEANYLNGVNNHRSEEESFIDRPGLSE
jgi:chromosome segregation ATPase